MTHFSLEKSRSISIPVLDAIRTRIPQADGILPMREMISPGFSASSRPSSTQKELDRWTDSNKISKKTFCHKSLLLMDFIRV